MSPSELNAILGGGESSSVEFKRCGDLPGNDVFSAFMPVRFADGPSNRRKGSPRP